MAELAAKLLKNVYSANVTQIRTLIKNKVSHGGIQYHGFKYHPRHPDFKDPPYEPSKLFLVTRIKKVCCTNPIERHALTILNLDGMKRFNGHKAIVKNIPEVNKQLWKIKHLVSIVPITLPQGMPPDHELGTCHLHDNGVLEVRPKVAEVVKERAALTDKFANSEKRMDSTLIKKFTRDRWMKPWQGTINDTDTKLH